MTHCDVHRIKLNLLLAQMALLWIFFSNSKTLKHGWLSTNLWLEIISEPSIDCHYRWGHSLKWKIRTILQRIMFHARQWQCLTVRWKRKTSYHSSSAHAVFYSFRLRLDPTAGCRSWFNDFLWYIISGYNTDLDAKWTMDGIFFSIVTLLLCFREESHSEN